MVNVSKTKPRSTTNSWRSGGGQLVLAIGGGMTGLPRKRPNLIQLRLLDTADAALGRQQGRLSLRKLGLRLNPRQQHTTRGH